MTLSSSKVNAALTEMARIKRDNPNDKIVVVSQFTSFLSVIQGLLREQGFDYVRLDGTMNHDLRSDVIKEFQRKGKGSPKVLLLSLKVIYTITVFYLFLDPLTIFLILGWWSWSQSHLRQPPSPAGSGLEPGQRVAVL